MEYEVRKTKPESNRKILVQQVQEQSDLCDVIVKMGHWEKRFHRCVVVASPFFDCILKNNFLEKQTGKIEIVLGTPITLEMAVMFLYGKKPKLSLDTIEDMLHLAEYLLIPNLKSACVSWMKTVNITAENCMNFLQLSSIFDFDIPKCTEYIEGHMTEMLTHSQMINITKDSIELLFSDRKLSYVSMDDKLKFLLKWRDCQSDQRKPVFKELLTAIDFQEVSLSLLEELKKEQSLGESIDFEKVLGNENNEQRIHRVLIMKGEGNEGSFWCLDLESEKWFRIDSRAYEEERSYRYNEIFGTENSGSEIYFTDNGYRKCGVLRLNLESDMCRTFKVVVKENGNDFQNFDDLQLYRETCFVNVNERIKLTKKGSMSTQSLDLQSRLRYMSLLGCSPLDQMLAVKMLENDLLMTRGYIDTSTLYTGEVSDEYIRLSPFLTIKDDQISQICLGNNLAVAMLFKSKQFVAVLDLADHTLEKIQLKTEYGDSLVQSEDGFVIYNNTRSICLHRLTGPLLSSKYQVKEISFDNKRFNHQKLYFCGNTWYHYYRKSYQSEFQFDSVPHSSVISAGSGSMDSVVWKPLPLPKEASKCRSSTMKDRLFEISLPKRMLRCNIECPHCKLSSRTTIARASYYDDDDYYYEDSSDDYYGYSPYDDYYCYDDSD